MLYVPGWLGLLAIARAAVFFLPDAVDPDLGCLVQCRPDRVHPVAAASTAVCVLRTEQSYDRMVLAVFENRRISERVKAYKLNTLFKCGPIKVRECIFFFLFSFLITSD